MQVPVSFSSHAPLDYHALRNKGRAEMLYKGGARISPYLDVASHDDSSISLKSSATKQLQLATYQQELEFVPNSYSLRPDFELDSLRDYHYEIIAHAPDKVPVLEGPLRGPDIQSNGDRHYGFLHVTGKDPQAYEQARDHLSQDPKMRSIWLQLEDGATYRRDGFSGKELPEDDPAVTSLKTTNDLFKLSEAKYDSISWNTRQAMLVQRKNDGRSSVISAATILGHEGIHRFHFATDLHSSLVRLATPIGRYNNREELSTTRHEVAFAGAIGEGQRRMYHGGILRMKSITNTLPQRFPRLQNTLARVHLRITTFPEHPTHIAKESLFHIASQGAGGLAYAKQQVSKLDSSKTMVRINRPIYHWVLSKMAKLHESPAPNISVNS